MLILNMYYQENVHAICFKKKKKPADHFVGINKRTIFPDPMNQKLCFTGCLINKWTTGGKILFMSLLIDPVPPSYYSYWSASNVSDSVSNVLHSSIYSERNVRCAESLLLLNFSCLCHHTVSNKFIFTKLPQFVFCLRC